MITLNEPRKHFFKIRHVSSEERAVRDIPWNKLTSKNSGKSYVTHSGSLSPALIPSFSATPLAKGVLFHIVISKLCYRVVLLTPESLVL